MPTKRSFPKSIYLDLISGKIGQATEFSRDKRFCNRDPDMRFVLSCYSWTLKEKRFDWDTGKWLIKISYDKVPREFKLNEDQLQKRVEFNAMEIYKKLRGEIPC